MRESLPSDRLPDFELGEGPHTHEVCGRIHIANEACPRVFLDRDSNTESLLLQRDFGLEADKFVKEKLLRAPHHDVVFVLYFHKRWIRLDFTFMSANCALELVTGLNYFLNVECLQIGWLVCIEQERLELD